jgi:hypothetical protein
MDYEVANEVVNEATTTTLYIAIIPVEDSTDQNIFVFNTKKAALIKILSHLDYNGDIMYRVSTGEELEDIVADIKLNGCQLQIQTLNSNENPEIEW